MHHSNGSLQPYTAIRTLTVTGSGKVTSRPNHVQIQIEVDTTGKEVSGAQQKNAAVMNQVIEAILGLRIPRENIQTAAYTIFPLYSYIEGKQILEGYQISNTITVKITDVSQAGTVIDTAVQNGANRISSLQFSIENPDFYYQQALSLALQNAQKKARTIADTMQLSLNPQPIEILEVSNAAPPVLYKSAAAAEQFASTPIEQGQINIDAAVNVTFQY